MSRISLCVIARDEERMLPGCLASVEGVVDEIVVVDTGSTDRTPVIARAAGATVVPFAWCDDFAAARNAAIPHATGDWLLVLDADERLAPGAGPLLRRAVERASFDLGLLLLHNATHAGAAPADVVSGPARLSAPLRVPRLVRRVPGLAWRGLIHENVREWLIARGGQAAPVDVDVVHLGASADERARRGKRERNVALLREGFRRDPADVINAGYLVLELDAAGAADEAARVAEEAWRAVDAQPPQVSIHRLAVARALVALRRGDYDLMLASVERAERRAGPHADTHHLRGVALENRARALPVGHPRRRALAAEAAAAYEAALAAANLLGLDHLIAAPFGEEGMTRLAAARAIAEEPPPDEARLAELEARLDGGDAAGALGLAEPLLSEHPDGWLLAAAAAHALGARDDALVLLARASERVGAGFVSPHRRARLEALSTALTPIPAAASRQPPVTAAAERYAVSIVSPPRYLHSEAFREVAEALCCGLRRLGRDAVLTTDTLLPGRRHVVLGANLVPRSRIPLAPGSILYNLEQVQAGPPWFDEPLVDLYRRHEVWDYSETNATALAALGLPRPRVVPIGYVPELTRIPPADEDVDVLFYGSWNDRRSAIVQELCRRGARVEALFGVYGAARDAVIARSKLVLNVHFYEAKVFEIVRVSYLLANRKVVVSERGTNPAEEAPFEHGIAFADYPRIVDTCLALLSDPAARRRIAAAGFDVIAARRQEDYLRAALET